MNGHTEAMDGVAGQHAVEERLGPRKLINRTEFVRLIEQALHRLGYADVAALLEQQAGVQMQPSYASEFQAAVMAGLWDQAIALLPQLTPQWGVIKDARFLILQQKYLEALERQDLGAALTCLRLEMAPLGVHEQQLHHLAALLLCPSQGDTSSRTSWLGGGAAHRGHLLALLQAKLPPNLMIPAGRLEALVEQALEAQIARCPYYDAGDSQLSLFCDLDAGMECLPTTTVQVLEGHSDEVWHVAFSHNGKMLASASKDQTAIIWSVAPSGQVEAVHVLSGHSHAVSSVCWSPDDSRLLTCSEETVRVWDVATGRLLQTCIHHRKSVNSVAWLPDGRRFISGGADRGLCLVDSETGAEVQGWKKPYRLQDLALTRDGGVVVMASSDKRIYLLRLSDHREVSLPTESVAITSITLSSDGRHLLVMLQDRKVHLWVLGSATSPYSPVLDIGPDPLDLLPAKPAAVYRYADGQPVRCVLPCEFGGFNNSFVVHGSEECVVFLWQRDTAQQLLKLSGHTAMVNSACWSPTNPYMLASASDDKTVRIWLAQAAYQGGAEAAARRKALPLLQPGVGWEQQQQGQGQQGMTAAPVGPMNSAAAVGASGGGSMGGPAAAAMPVP